MHLSNIKFVSLRKGIILFIFVLCLAGCKDQWLTRDPVSIIENEQVWNDQDLIRSMLANYYNRLPAHQSLTKGWRNFARYTNAMWSGQKNHEGLNNLPDYNYDAWAYWDYDLIRDINLAIENIDKYSREFSPDQKAQFKSEFRFLRAYIYFNLVKRMGGVPIITHTLPYDFSGDPSYLQKPRNTEAEVYDFIAKEIDAIKDSLGNAGSVTRANKWTALALKSRAMLFAGSIAKYNNLMSSPISTAGGEVGIPASRAEEYYQKSFEASLEIIQNGPYSLYQVNPDPGLNFYEAITDKTNNPEVIWVQDFDREAGKQHRFTVHNISPSFRSAGFGFPGSITPSLNLVEAFEYLDGSSGKLENRTPDDSDYIYYENTSDIFADKDPRLWGTIMYPGSTFKGAELKMQAGVAVWDAGTNSYNLVEDSKLGSTYEDGGILTAEAGPHATIQSVSNTGFYIRKYIDKAPGAGSNDTQSGMWWIRFRLGEIYLNAAEAAFELDETGDALNYINKIRERAGFGPNSLITLTFEDIRHARRVELAFEGHRLWDLKRWRLAHEVWNGNPDNRSAMAYALYPYRVIRPGDPSKDGKYIFVEKVAPRFRAPRYFRMGNYYSAIPQRVLNNNDLIVKNPFH